MAYLDHQHTHKRIAGVTGVAVVHLVLAAGLVAGLAVDAFVEEKEGPLILIDPTIDPPTPDPVPTTDPQPVENAYTPPVGPVPPIDLGRADPVDTVIAFPPDGPVVTVVDNGLANLPIRPIEPPAPRFTPRGPVPSNGPAGWVTNNDYPRSTLIREQEGDVVYALDIGTDGRVDGCRIIASSGYDALDRQTCRLIERRARFDPATDNAGETVAGTWRGTVSWTIPED